MLATRRISRKEAAAREPETPSRLMHAALTYPGARRFS